MLDEYTVNTVKVSKMLLGFFVLLATVFVDNSCEEQKQLPYWNYAVALHMSLLTLLDPYLIFVTTNELLMNRH